MSTIVEIVLDPNDHEIFSNLFPPELQQVVDPRIFGSIVSTINQSIKSATYSNVFKLINAISFISIFIPMGLHFYDKRITWAYLFIPACVLLIVAFYGYLLHVQTRRHSIQDALVTVNNHLIGHQPPLSVRLYHAPDHIDRANVGLLIDW